MNAQSKKQNLKFGLEKKSFPKHKQWMVDQDYDAKLSQEERDFLARFNQEYYRNTFESSENDLHNTPELKRACYSNENARGRDLYARESVKNNMTSTRINTEDGEMDLLDTYADYDMGYAMVDEQQERSSKAKKTSKKNK